jgi:hypothetical protein
MNMAVQTYFFIFQFHDENKWYVASVEVIYCIYRRNEELRTWPYGYK